MEVVAGGRPAVVDSDRRQAALGANKGILFFILWQIFLSHGNVGFSWGWWECFRGDFPSRVCCFKLPTKHRNVKAFPYTKHPLKVVFQYAWALLNEGCFLISHLLPSTSHLRLISWKLASILPRLDNRSILNIASIPHNSIKKKCWLIFISCTFSFTLQQTPSPRLAPSSLVITT